MAGETKLKVHKHTEQYALATFGPVLLQLWQLSTPLEGALEARRIARELSREVSGPAGSVVIVPEQSVVPEKEARVELSQLPTDLEKGVGLVLVQEGTGFRASAVRAVLATMMLVSRRSMPHDVVPTVALGSAWLTDRLIVPGGKTALIGAINELRSLYAASQTAQWAATS